MERTILHSDINCCYAAIEHLHHPELAGKPLAVGGDPESRHGIVLTADYIAKKHGVKTGMALWQAKQVCPDITFISPRMDLYLRFSRMAHEIYSEYTDLQEPYGIDESWLDVSASSSIKGDGYKIAEEISNRMKSELGITVSIGVSFDKIYAKLGSDYKKPDAITTMYKDEFRQKAWKLPASDLLYVGRSTNQKLLKIGIKTIGDLARMDEHILVNHLGKMGSVLWAFANGYDESPVRLEDTHAPIKSVGNSTTTPRDLENDEDVKIVLYILAESVAARLRENGFRCRMDGLTGFPQAIEAVYPKNEIQQCIIHQIRNSTKFVSYKDIKKLMADLKLVYAAPTEETALNELELFKDKWDSKYPKIYKSWHDNWATLSTYFKYPEVVRRLIYTTNAIEGFNRQLRKVTKSKTVFPSDDSLLKMLYLATMDITRKWTGHRQDWGQIHSQLEIYFEERLSGKNL